MAFSTGSTSDFQEFFNRITTNLPENQNHEISAKDVKELFLVINNNLLSPYRSNLEYSSNSFVEHNGKIWKSKISVPTNTTPQDPSSYWALVGGVEQIDYIKQTPILETVGGLQANNYTPSGTIKDLLDDMLYPFQQPSFSSFNLDGQSGTLEVGDEISSGSQTFSWSTNNDNNIQSNSIEIEDLGNTNILASGLTNDGSETVSLPSSISKTSPNTNHQFQIRATDTQSNGFSRNDNYVWRARVFYGKSTGTTLNESEIESLANNPLSANFSGQYSYGSSSGYIYLCYPDSFGSVSSITDDSTGFNVPYVIVGTVNVTNSFGVTLTYEVVRSDNQLNSSITVNVS